MARKLVTPVQARRGFGFIDIQPDGSVQFNPDVGLSNRGPFPVIDVDSYTFPPASQWGITDETAGIQAALNAAAAYQWKAQVRFSSRPYKVQSLTWPQNVYMVGAGHDPFNELNGTLIYGTPGYDTLIIQDVPNGGRAYISDLSIIAGNNGIACYTSNYVTHIGMKRIAIIGAGG